MKQINHLNFILDKTAENSSSHASRRALWRPSKELKAVTNKSHVPGSLLLVLLPVMQAMTCAMPCPPPQVYHSRDLINASIHLPRDTSINLPQDLKTHTLTHTHTHWRSRAGDSAPRTDHVTFKDILPLHTPPSTHSPASRTLTDARSANPTALCINIKGHTHY
jgi:hypothetical protein